MNDLYFQDVRWSPQLVFKIVKVGGLVRFSVCSAIKDSMDVKRGRPTFFYRFVVGARLFLKPRCIRVIVVKLWSKNGFSHVVGTTSANLPSFNDGGRGAYRYSNAVC